MYNYDVYDDVLRRVKNGCIVVLILTLVLAAFLLCMNVKGHLAKGKPLIKLLINSFVGGIVVAELIYFGISIGNIITDINEQSYIVYEGEFVVSEHNDGYTTIIVDGEKTTLSGEADLPGGTYLGEVVYGKNSKHAVDWFVEETLK